MSRITWFAAGAATGVYGIFRAKRVARNLTPDGLAARAAAVGAGLRVFSSAVATGMAEREGQLRHQLALTPARPAGAVPPIGDTATGAAPEAARSERIGATGDTHHRQSIGRTEGARGGHR
jgi:hypothetical protein